MSPRDNPWPNGRVPSPALVNLDTYFLHAKRVMPETVMVNQNIFVSHVTLCKAHGHQTEPGPHLNRFIKACKAHGRPSIPKIKAFQTVLRPVALIALSNRPQRSAKPKPFQTVFGEKKILNRQSGNVCLHDSE